MLGALSFWVPISLEAISPYFGVDFFHGIRPRAILGSIIYLLPFDSTQIDLVGNVIKLLAVWIWLFLVQTIFYHSIFHERDAQNYFLSWLVFIGIGFIFAASSITYITFSATGIIDAFPAAIVALVISTDYLLECDRKRLLKVIVITILLVLACLSHEKTIYELLILLLWFSVKWGPKKSILYFGPSLVLSALLLLRMANKMSAEQTAPAGYLEILSSGLTYFWVNAFNIWGIIFGAGAFWGLYTIGSSDYIQQARSKWTGYTRLGVIVLMPCICLLPLLVALDTSRFAASMWLPVVLVFQAINVRAVFSSLGRRSILASLCVFQFLIPPMLIYHKGMAPFNCYGLWLGHMLPTRAQIDFLSLGAFGLYFHQRPEQTNFFSTQCPTYFK
jgi:hypothetical protein